MQFQLNGKPEQSTKPYSFLKLLEKYQLKAEQVAVARNGEVLLRSQLDQIEIEEGDEIEIFHAVGGG